MAVIDVNFYSQSLVRYVSYKAIVPLDSYNPNNRDDKPFKTLYLLHGIMGNYQDWMLNTKIHAYAIKYNLAIIMPSGDNAFYVDHPDSYNNYGKFIGEELIKETRRLLPLSTKKEDTFIGGLSMGGYGAVRNGLKYSNMYSAIIGLSSAFIVHQVIHATEENSNMFSRKSFLESVFGDLTKVIGSDKDYEALTLKLLENNQEIPDIYLACGTEDFLIENNRRFHKFLLDHNVKHTYVEDSGVHDWIFWDKQIEKALNWLINK
jgi:S-formylglutathione hydrolase FrmB